MELIDTPKDIDKIVTKMTNDVIDFVFKEIYALDSKDESYDINLVLNTFASCLAFIIFNHVKKDDRKEFFIKITRLINENVKGMEKFYGVNYE